MMLKGQKSISTDSFKKWYHHDETPKRQLLGSQKSVLLCHTFWAQMAQLNGTISSPYPGLWIYSRSPYGCLSEDQLFPFTADRSVCNSCCIYLIETSQQSIMRFLLDIQFIHANIISQSSCQYSHT